MMFDVWLTVGKVLFRSTRALAGLCDILVMTMPYEQGGLKRLLGGGGTGTAISECGIDLGQSA